MEQSPYPRMAAALLALLGLLDAIYLSLERISGGALVCPVGGGCETVQGSAYATLLGVPVAYVGVASYALLLVVALASLHRERLAGVPLPTLLLALASAGVLFSLYLTYLQIAVIGAICFWCVTSALLELGIWIASFANWRQVSAQTRTSSPTTTKQRLKGPSPR